MGGAFLVCQLLAHSYAGMALDGATEEDVRGGSGSDLSAEPAPASATEEAAGEEEAGEEEAGEEELEEAGEEEAEAPPFALRAPAVGAQRARPSPSPSPRKVHASVQTGGPVRHAGVRPGHAPRHSPPRHSPDGGEAGAPAPRRLHGASTRRAASSWASEGCACHSGRPAVCAS